MHRPTGIVVHGRIRVVGDVNTHHRGDRGSAAMSDSPPTWGPNCRVLPQAALEFRQDAREGW